MRARRPAISIPALFLVLAPAAAAAALLWAHAPSLFAAEAARDEPALELAREYPPADEEKDLARLVELMLEAQEERLREKGRPARRGQHAKHHGCVRGEFEVLSDIPEKARHGVLREPGRRYPAWLRFSNGSSEIKPDTAKDAHGLAVKLMGVEGDKLHEDERQARTQDFVLIDHPVFFLSTVKDYVALFEELAEGSGRRYFLPGLNPFKWKLRQMLSVRAAVSKKLKDPAATSYFSTVPSLLGPGAVKYSARPCSAGPKPGKDKSPDRLRATLSRRLASESLCFLFLVQWQTDAVKMPIEDPMVRWDEKASPFIPVARLSVPPQRFDTPARQEYCENLYFTPWHALPEHRPLGGIQRARLQVYKVLSRFRRMKNGAPLREPEAGDAIPD